MPELLVYFISDKPKAEKEFGFFLEKHRYSKKRPKILLVSIVDSGLLLPLCEKYNIEGIIDHMYFKEKLNQLVSRILAGEIIREFGKVEITTQLVGKLTKKEIAFAILLLNEYSKPQIIAILKISEKTFRRRKTEIFKKCRVTTLIGLYKMFLEKKIDLTVFGH